LLYVVQLSVLYIYIGTKAVSDASNSTAPLSYLISGRARLKRI
jgi:hypothetical protein